MTAAVPDCSSQTAGCAVPRHKPRTRCLLSAPCVQPRLAVHLDSLFRIVLFVYCPTGCCVVTVVTLRSLWNGQLLTGLVTRRFCSDSTHFLSDFPSQTDPKLLPASELSSLLLPEYLFPTVKPSLPVSPTEICTQSQHEGVQGAFLGEGPPGRRGCLGEGISV